MEGVEVSLEDEARNEESRDPLIHTPQALVPTDSSHSTKVPDPMPHPSIASKGVPEKEDVRANAARLLRQASLAQHQRQRTDAGGDLESSINALLEVLTSMNKKDMNYLKVEANDEESGDVRRDHAPQDLPVPKDTTNSTNDNGAEEGNESSENAPVQDEEEEEKELRIPEDSFSMLYVAKTWREHVLPLLIFAMQIAMLGLLIGDLARTNDSPLALVWNIPVNVPTDVTVAQYLACFVSVFTASDFVDGILFSQMHIICDEDERQNRRLGGFRFRFRLGGFRRLGRLADRGRGIPLVRLENVTRMIAKMDWKWEISNLMRMAEGIFATYVSFLFVIRSTAVIDLFLNFVGVAFVSELDDIAFRLSKIGFLGQTSQQTASLVEKHKVDWGNKQFTKKKWKRRSTARIITFAAIIVAMWAALTWIDKVQDHNLFACKSVTITVGEAKNVHLRLLSGKYTIAEKQFAERAMYVQDQGKEKNSSYIAYCKKDRRWAVTPHIDWQEEDGCHKQDYRLDPCNCYYLQSEQTRAFDITEISGFKHYSGDDVDSSLKCNDCKVGKDDETDATCGWEGKCEETPSKSGNFQYKLKTCSCTPGYFGDSCQFPGPCTEMAFQGDGFPGYGKRFDLLYDEGKPLMVHERPAYNITTTSSSDDDSAVLLFDGGRWLVIPSAHLSGNLTNFNALKKSVRYRYVEYISEYTTEGSPANVPFRALLSEPSYTSVGKLGDAEFNLLCADCHDDDGGDNISYLDCQGSQGRNKTLCQPYYSSIHGNINRCKCEPGFIGPLCQTRPVEGNLLLFLEHEKTKVCSVCGENNMRTVHQLVGLYNKTCLPFPREPLLFNGGNDTTVSRQLGLNLNETHFSVFVSSSGRFFQKSDSDIYNNGGASELLCSVQEGSSEIFSMKRSVSNPKEQASVDLAVLLNTNKDFLGEPIDPSGIDCLAKSSIDEDECDGSKNLTLQQIYDPALNDSHLMRAWIQLDLKVT